MSEEITIESNDGTEFVIPVSALRAAVGFDEISERLFATEQAYTRAMNALEELLGYVGNVDLRVQQLAGEPTVSRTLIPHIDGAGYLRFDSDLPEVPDEVLRSFLNSSSPNAPIGTVDSRPSSTRMVR